MSPLAIFLILIATVLSASRDFLTKQSHGKLLFVWWVSFVSLLMSVPVCLYFLYMFPPDTISLIFALSMGIVHALYWMFYAQAYENGDISHVYPIIRSSPAFVLIFGILFLNEHPNMLGITGILAITFGLYLLNMKSLGFRNLMEPLKAIRNEAHTQLAFLALIMVVTYSLLDKVAVTRMHPFVYIFLMNVSALCIFSFFIRKKVRASVHVWSQPWTDHRQKLLLASLFAAVNYPLVLYVLQFTNASYVSAFRQVSVILALGFGTIFLREKFTFIRAGSAVLIFIGALLIAV